MTEAKNAHNESEPTTRLSKAVVVLLCALPLIAAVAYGAVDSSAIGLVAALVAVIAVLWLADGVMSGSLPFSPSLIQLPIIGLIIVGVIQLLPLGSAQIPTDLLNAPVARALSLDPYATRLFLMRLVICFLFFAVAMAYIPNGSRAKKIAVVIVVFGALLAFFGILQRLAMPEAIYGLRETPQAIPFGPYVNQHHFAGLMEMTSGIALGLLFGSGISRERKIFVAIAAGIMGMAIIFTGSRGGLMSYLGVIAFAAIASFARRVPRRTVDEETPVWNRNLLVMAAAGGLIILVFGSVLFLGGEASLLRGIGLQEGAADVTSGRAHFWSVAWQVFLANPVIGAGFDAFGVAFTRFDTWNGYFRVEQVHNDYLQILADAGILGFLCIAAFLVLLSKSGFSALNRSRDATYRGVVVGSLAGCFGIVIHSFFDFPLRTPANAFFFLLLVVLAVGKVGVTSARSRRGRSNAP